MKNFIKSYYHLVVIFLVSLAPFAWFSNNEIIYGPDTIWALNNNRGFGSIFETWKSGVGFGYGWSDVGVFMHNLYVSLLSLLGINYSLTQKIIISFLIFTSALFAYKIFIEVSSPTKYTKLYALVAAVLYVTNPYALSWIWWRFLGVIYFYPAFALLIYLILRIVKSNISNKTLLLYSLLLCLFAPGYSAIVLLASLVICCFVILITSFLVNNLLNVKLIMKQLLMLGVFFILLNAYWILPGLLMIPHSIAGALTAYDPNAVFYFTSEHSSLINTVRLWGHHIIYLDFMGESYYGNGLSKILATSWYSYILYIPILLILVLMFKLKKQDYKNKYLVISLMTVFLVSVFLMKGANEPFGFINFDIINLPFGAGYRIPYDKFGYWAALSLSLLVPLTLFIRFKSRIPKIIIRILIVLYILMPLSIFFSNSMLAQDKTNIKGVVAQIPSEYEQLKDINFSPADKVLVLPPTIGGESAYDWPKGAQTNSHDILSDIIPASIVMLPNGNLYNDNKQNFINNDLFTGLYQPSTVQKYLNQSGINYVFVHKDWSAKFMGLKVQPPEHFTDVIKDFKNASVAKDNDYYTIYYIGSYSPSYVYSNFNIADNKTPINLNLAQNLGIDNSIPIVTDDADQFNFNDSDEPQYTIVDNSIFYDFKNTFNQRVVFNKSVINNYYEKLNISVDDKNVSNIESSDFYYPKDNVRITNLGQNEKTIVNDAGFENVANSVAEDWECQPKNGKYITGIKNRKDSAHQTYVQIESHENKQSCHMKIFSNLKSGTNTLLSIDYKNNTSTNSRIIVIATDNNLSGSSRIVVNKELGYSSQWTTTKVSFSNAAEKNYRMFLYSGSSDGYKSITDFDNLKIQTVPEGFNELMISRPVGYKSNLIINSKSSPQHIWQGNDNNKEIQFVYEKGMLISAPYTYDPFWNASINNVAYSPKLVLVNGYLAGWILNSSNLIEGNTYTLKTSYKAQKVASIGAAISLVSLITICLALLSLFVKQMKRK